MNKYIRTEEDEVSKKGIIGTILFHMLLLLCLWFLSMTAVPPKVKGMLINFGTVETGQGKESPQSEKENTPTAPPKEQIQEAVEQVAESKPQKQTPKPAIEQEVHKIQDTKAPSVPTKKPDKSKDVKEKEVPKKTKPKVEPPKEVKEKEKKEEEQPVVDERALFKKRDNTKSNTNNSSQGNNNPMDDQGNEVDEDYRNQNSDVYTPSRDIGMSDTGNFKVDLAGRNLIERPAVSNNFTKEGKVAVKIKVDSNGRVIGAEATTKGSSTSDATLRKIAVAAAKKAKFNFDPNAPAVQTGTITFTFKIR